MDDLNEPTRGMRAAVSTFMAPSTITTDIATRHIDVTSPAVTHILDWWYAVNGGRVPFVDQFDVVEHLSFAQHLLLIHRLEDDVFRFAVVGELLIQEVGTNYTGLELSTKFGIRQTASLYWHYRSIVLDGLPRLRRGTLSFADRPLVHFEGLDCPLVDRGGHIARLVGVFDIVAQA